MDSAESMNFFKALCVQVCEDDQMYKPLLYSNIPELRDILSIVPVFQVRCPVVPFHVPHVDPLPVVPFHVPHVDPLPAVHWEPVVEPVQGMEPKEENHIKIN